MTPSQPSKSHYESPKYEAALDQLRERENYHGSRTDDDYSRGYIGALGMYRMYAAAGKSNDPDLVKGFRETVRKEQDWMHELATRELPSAKDDPLGLKRSEIIQARGYMKGLGDAAKARKGILLE